MRRYFLANLKININMHQALYKMQTLLFAVKIFNYLNECSGAIDSGVIVFGTTVGPNYHRPEGIGR